MAYYNDKSEYFHHTAGNGQTLGSVLARLEYLFEKTPLSVVVRGEDVRWSWAILRGLRTGKPQLLN